MVGFYRNFIRDFATISQPLNKPTCDNVPYLLTNNCELAVQILKQQLQSRPVLAFPKLGTQIVVEVDAIYYSAGRVSPQLSYDSTVPSCILFYGIQRLPVRMNVYSKRSLCPRFTYPSLAFIPCMHFICTEL